MLSLNKKCQDCRIFKCYRDSYGFKFFKKTELDLTNSGSKNTVYFVSDSPFFSLWNNKNMLNYIKYIFDGFNIHFISLTNCFIHRKEIRSKQNTDFNYCTFKTNDIEENRKLLLSKIPSEAFIVCFGNSISNFFGIYKPIYYSEYNKYNHSIFVVPKPSLFRLNYEHNIKSLYSAILRNNTNEIPFTIVNVRDIYDIIKLKNSKQVCLDIESNSLNYYSDSFKITHIAILDTEEPDKIYLFKDASLDLIKEIDLFNKTIIGYNVKFDIMSILLYFKYPMDLLDKISYKDVLFYIYLKDEVRFLSAADKGLKSMVCAELNINAYDNPMPEIIKNNKDLEILRDTIKKYEPITMTARQRDKYNRVLKEIKEIEDKLNSLYKKVDIYNCSDAYYTFLLYEKLRNTVNNKCINFMNCLDRFLLKVHNNGFKVDIDKLNILDKNVSLKIEEILLKLKNYKDINWNSTEQLSNYLKSLNLRGIKYISDKCISTTESDLKYLKSVNKEYTDLFNLLLNLRFWVKQKTTYIDSYRNKIDNNGYIHGNFNPTGTCTGRISSSSPNLQQVANRGIVKKFLCSRFGDKGYILELDYSQMEMRVMGMYSGDPKLYDIFSNDKDIYLLTASLILNKDISEITPAERNDFKTMVLGLQYGMSKWGVARAINISVEQAEAFIEKYFSIYAGIRAYNQKCYESALNNGYVEYSIGRIRHFPETQISGLSLSKEQYARIYRESTNAPIQGTASDLCLINAMCFDKKFLKNKKSCIINVIHDSILFDVEESEKDYIENSLKFLENCPKFPQFKYIVPLKFKYKFYKQYWDTSEDLYEDITRL